MNGGEGQAPADFRAWCAAQPVSAGTRGHEAMVEGVVAAVPRRTWLLPGRRERGAAILRGAEPARLHEARPYRVLPPGESPAARALTGVGLALGGESAVVFLGTGSVAYGAFHEALHAAASHRAPVLFVVSWYVGDGPFAPQLALPPDALAAACGLAVGSAPGTDADAVRAAATALLPGPALLRCDFGGRA